MAEYHMITIGAGPAGLAATAYALQAQLHSALISPILGGKVSEPFELRGLPAVDNVWGVALVQELQAYVEANLSHYFAQTVTQIERRDGGGFQLTLADQTVLGTRALLVCTGAEPQKLAVPGEETFAGHGVSFSAISHARFFQDRPVAVVGGERALPAVLKLAELASRVYYILARPRATGASQLSAAVLRHPKVYLFHEWEVSAIVGDHFVTGVDLVGANGVRRSLAVDGVFIERGLLPNSALVRDMAALDEQGRIMVNQRCETDVPGLFAAGDVTNIYAEQVPIAIGEGMKAALGAWSYLR